MKIHGIRMGLLTAGLFASTASAQLIINPVTKPAGDKIEVGISAAYSSFDYVLSEIDQSIGIKRMALGVSLAKGIDEDAEVCGSVAWLAKTDTDAGELASNGGYLLSLGARLHVFERGLGTVTLYGLGHYMAEKYDAQGAGKYDMRGSSYDMFLFEVTGGAIAAYAFHPSLICYAGLELIAYSDGELRGDDRPDFDRDGRITIRGGAVFDMNKYAIRTELALGSETALLIGASRVF